MRRDFVPLGRNCQDERPSRSRAFRNFLVADNSPSDNLYERVEMMFPVKDPAHRTQVTEILNHYLRDTTKSRLLHANGKYLRAFHGDSSKVSRNGNRFSVQTSSSTGPKAVSPRKSNLIEHPLRLGQAESRFAPQPTTVVWL